MVSMRRSLAPVEVAVRGEVFRVGVVVRVIGYFVLGDTDRGSGWDVETVFECIRRCGHSLQRY